MSENQSDIGKKKGVLYMAVMARPDKKPFVVSSDKVKEFNKKTISKQAWNEIFSVSKDFDKNNLQK